MEISLPAEQRPALASEIGAKVRALRAARRWTQAELAQRLGVAQGRLSDLERGKASFTAEQFLTILQLFNVPASEFVSRAVPVEVELQNALVRLGASHLVEAGQAVPSERLREVNAVVREVLVDPSAPRMVTALGPVLVQNADRVSLRKVALELRGLGLEHRLYWLVENVLAAVGKELAAKPEPARARLLRRAEVVLRALGEGEVAAKGRSRLPADVLDQTARSDEALRSLHEEASAISRRWNVATALQVDDFRDALRQTNESV